LPPAQETDSTANTDFLLKEALGKPDVIRRRGDGKPVTSNGHSISAAHARDLTLAVAGSAGIACDLETVVARSAAVWRDLLGNERYQLAQFIAREQIEGSNEAATRLWTSLECLKKTGLPVDAPLVLASAPGDGWVLLRSGNFMIATCVTAVRGLETALAIAVAFNPATFRTGLDFEV
jgi:enediyne polyketide synthase